MGRDGEGSDKKRPDRDGSTKIFFVHFFFVFFFFASTFPLPNQVPYIHPYILGFLLASNQLSLCVRNTEITQNQARSRNRPISQEDSILS